MTLERNTTEERLARIERMLEEATREAQALKHPIKSDSLNGVSPSPDDAKRERRSDGR
jgi:hypothetical protein